ncbi:hypothetical protein KEM55_008414 [Ascosphaera atra]|nr:hypothetical protein KEM55_008414 [Ascosphaera atra]
MEVVTAEKVPIPRYKPITTSDASCSSVDTAFNNLRIRSPTSPGKRKRERRPHRLSIDEALLSGRVEIPSRSKSGVGSKRAWTREEDRLLLQARESGKGWRDIGREVFAGKSANACRKRWERVTNGVKKSNDREMQQILDRYYDYRERIWMPLARDLKKDWQLIERNVIDGLTLGRGLQSPSDDDWSHNDVFSEEDEDEEAFDGYESRMTSPPKRLKSPSMSPETKERSTSSSSGRDASMSISNLIH